MNATSGFRVEKDRHIARFFLSRPEKRNAMTHEFFQGLLTAFTDFSEDPDVRVVIIQADGPSFTAGLDLNSLAGLAMSREADARENLRRIVLRGQATVNAVEDCHKPVIAAVHGHCIGGGVDLICTCDIRLAARDAIFAVRETKLALVADLGTLQRLPSIVGEPWARELCLTGRNFSAEEAYRIGLVTHLCDDQAALNDLALKMATEIAENSPLAVQGVKDVMRFTRDNGVKPSLEYVAQKNAAILICDDVLEAINAFIAKRPPDFKGR